MEELISHPVIIFDGVCNLCNSSVQFIIKHDKKQVFRFASLQSEFGKKIITKFDLANKNIDSIILFENNYVLIKSTAALQIAKKMGGIYSTLYVLCIHSVIVGHNLLIQSSIITFCNSFCLAHA